MIGPHRLKKYLFTFGYLGTRFRGVQKDLKLGKEDQSITRYLEDALLSLCPLNTPEVYNSSRTDKGVHALRSTFHCTLCLPVFATQSDFCISITEENYITSTLNKYFEDSGLEIRIYDAREVPLEFHSRHRAIRRTYLYRLAHYLGKEEDINFRYFDHIPFPEVNRCGLFGGEFDLDAVKSACKILEGRHDFRYYTKFTKTDLKRHIPDFTVRTVDEVRFVPGRPIFDPRYDERYKHFRFYDILFSSRSFLYNQVRRLVAVLTAVGKKQYDLRDVEATLENPDKAWDCRVTVAKACGLYLMDVEYPPEAFLEETYQTQRLEANTGLVDKAEDTAESVR